MTEPLLEVRGLKKYFPIRGGVFMKVVAHVHAVDDIGFHIMPGETLGLVGESGCGKSTVGRTLIQLYEPDGGEVTFDGHQLEKMSPKELAPIRKSLQMIFQDPYESLNPRLSVEDILMESYLVHKVGTRKENRMKIHKLLERVGLSSKYGVRYPHEFSGGQRQRVGIARAIAHRPKLVVCDEAVSALDVSVQSQVLNLLLELQEEMGMSYLFISHDLAVVRHVSDRVAVMYLGKIVEITDADTIYNNPRHPYTKALLSAIPKIDPKTRSDRVILEGDVPSPINLPNGCRFAGRCPHVKDICHQSLPTLEPLKDGSSSHEVACFRVDEI